MSIRIINSGSTEGRPMTGRPKRRYKKRVRMPSDLRFLQRIGRFPGPAARQEALLTVRNQRYSHQLNRKRNKLKNDASREFGSDIVEEKSYARTQ